MAFINRGTPFTLTASGTSTQTVNKTGVASAIFYLTDVACFGGTNGTLTVTSGTAAGTQTIWQVSIGSGSLYAQSFSTPVAGIIGGSMQAQMAVGSALVSSVSISGYQIGPF